MALQLHDTLSRSVRPFTPRAGQPVTVYACGPTVYLAPHIGNFRTFVFNDLLHRYLEWRGHEVRFVMNLTDVEDKIIEGARERGVDIATVTAPQTEAFFADLRALGVRPADAYPRATEHMDAMVALVERLLAQGHAYEREGSVYFDIASFPEYGRLARIDLSQTRAGAGLADRERGIDADEYEKADARDFALWKAARDADREVGAAWPTPWGHGRPGWHIECSAMSMAELGETLDIHTGGEDLIFPHHEDEIAQSEAATGQTFVRYWLHVKHLKVNGQKMSKSKGNAFTIADLVARGHRPSAIRYLLLMAHYRSELNFTFEGLEDARGALRRLLDFAHRLEAAPLDADAPDTGLAEAARAALVTFQAGLDDDLNTPVALRALFDFVREANAALDGAARIGPADQRAAAEAMERMDDVLGIVGLTRAEEDTVDEAFAAWVEERLTARREARARRDFPAADAIRDELGVRGVVVEDTPQGVRWRREYGTADVA
jgi:cysteinyl-tRNA synthetase